MKVILPTILQRLLWLPARVAFEVFTGLRVRGAHHLRGLDRSRGVLLVANHTRQLDVAMIPSALPFFTRLLPVYFITLTTQEYAHLPFAKYLYGGTLFKIFGGYPVVRGLQNYEETLKQHIEFLEEGRTVIIFPEGGFTKTGELKEPKQGVAFLAKRTGALIVPLAVTGVYKVSFVDFFLRRRSATVEFGEPFRYAGNDPKEVFGAVEKIFYKNREI